MVHPELFIGLTTWNSSSFLPTTLTAIRRTTDRARTRIFVLDNFSTDATVSIARDFGAEVLVRRGGQAAALMDLFNFSGSELTLLMHADVILLDPRWLDVCKSKLVSNTALVSPEDIGCGPYTRPWGIDKPESSFMLFRTALARYTRQWYWRRRFRMRLPYRGIDVTGEHITYNLPQRLAEKGLIWQKMQVHVSTATTEPIYAVDFEAPHWKPHLANYRYGLGNFYSLDGVVTHYHNWYERALDARITERTLPVEAGGLPVAFLKTYSRNFLDDYAAGQVDIPELSNR